MRERDRWHVAAGAVCLVAAAGEREGHGDAVPLAPLADLAGAHLELLYLPGDPAASPERPQQTVRAAEVAERAPPAAAGGGSEVADVAVDAALRVVGEVPDLPHPRADVVVAVAGAGVAGGEVEEEAVHAVHLVPDEAHVAADAAQQLRLVGERRGEAAQERVHRALRRAEHEAVHGGADAPQRPSDPR
ncbi:hypothetical protein GQ55_8G192200 [Panicum hallii var. hallii]|uniref:Uncharacterized protein n=1 Tax=Panicum hallii var. hallii TaxID=1504633 RepID=A0A2T7CP19_9POAL|nr:hypothetical protein GQ55_8G192200 [Panicum hallii var. hallii]